MAFATFDQESQIIRGIQELGASINFVGAF